MCTGAEIGMLVVAALGTAATVASSVNAPKPPESPAMPGPENISTGDTEALVELGALDDEEILLPTGTGRKTSSALSGLGKGGLQL